MSNKNFLKELKTYSTVKEYALQFDLCTSTIYSRINRDKVYDVVYVGKLALIRLKKP